MWPLQLAQAKLLSISAAIHSTPLRVRNHSIVNIKRIQPETIGLGINRPSVPQVLERALAIKSVLHRWRETQVLVIDEGEFFVLKQFRQNQPTGFMLVSMIDAWTFDMLNTIGQETRRNRKPFGGIQVRHKLSLNCSYATYVFSL